jgi:hypothetical protein
MNRLALSVLTLLVAAPALADHHEGQAAAGNPMEGWKSPKIANEARDRKEIAAVIKKMEQAGKKKDLEAAAALVDFPVLMVTDDSKGEAMGELWTREQWVKVMEPFYSPSMPSHTATYKPTVFLMSDSLASVDNVVTMTMGGKKTTARSSTLLIRKGGEWRVKAMVEGGWGDMPMPTAAKESAPGESATGTGAGMEMPPRTTETPQGTTK